MEEWRCRHDAALRIPSFAVRHRNRDRQRPRAGRSCLRRSRPGTGLARRHAAPLAPSGLCRGSRRRSEEHTSEFQSHVNLVCRLLLEKKKKTYRLSYLVKKKQKITKVKKY